MITILKEIIPCVNRTYDSVFYQTYQQFSVDFETHCGSGHDSDGGRHFHGRGPLIEC